MQATRGGVVESTHRGSVAVADAEGTLLGARGDVDALIFPRSAVKPFQAAASQSLLASVGQTLPEPGLAAACASHTGTDDPQIEAAHLLALAGLDESALACPRAWPLDTAALRAADGPTALAGSCSGKHAAFLWAHTATGGDPASYLDPACPLQERVRAALAEATGTAPTGPAVDGCGAPAWRLPLVRLATGFARLAAGTTGLVPVRAAMTGRPDLVGGADCPDTRLMLGDPRVVAKRGAEGVLAAGFVGLRGPVGVAVKVADGTARGALPPVAAVLHGLGATVANRLIRAPILAGGQPHGWVEPTPPLVDWAAELGA